MFVGKNVEDGDKTVTVLQFGQEIFVRQAISSWEKQV